MFSRRKPLPALVMILILALIAGAVWVRVLGNEATVTDRVRCPAVSAQTAVDRFVPLAQTAVDRFVPLPYNALDRVTPAAPAQVSVHVLNSTDRSGLARSIAEDLEALGFQRAGQPAIDEFYRTGTMHCVGQIRFGRSGRPAARTVSLLVPCTQLILDDRRNPTVDLVLGAAFTTLSEDYRVHAVLRQLEDWASRHPESEGGLQSVEAGVPAVSPSLLADARSAVC